jgi:hypothetical protein
VGAWDLKHDRVGVEIEVAGDVLGLLGEGSLDVITYESAHLGPAPVSCGCPQMDGIPAHNVDASIATAFGQVADGELVALRRQ